MAINSKNKGNTYERKVANLLSERFATIVGKSQGFYRNPSSGSYFGASNQKRLQTHLAENAVFGDIIAPSTFKFTIECKHYKTPPSFAQIVGQKCSLFDKWISQAKQDSQNAQKAFCIIAKFNNVADFVIVADDPNGDAFGRYQEYWLIDLRKWLSRDDSAFFGA